MVKKRCESRSPILLVFKSHCVIQEARPKALPSSLKLSTTQEDSLLSCLSHCILPINLNMAVFRIQHKASFCSHFSLHSPWALPTTLLQLCLLFCFRRCVEVTPAKTEEPEGVRTWLHHLTHCLYPYKQGNKDVASPFPCVYRPIKAEPDRYQFFN